MKYRNKIATLVLFAMYGAMMFASKIAFEALPNIHPLSMFIMTFTVVYRFKALIPIYIYIFLNGLFAGFDPMWFIPYLYIWGLQCLITLLIPKKIPDKAAAVVYPIVCALFGLTFGAMYAPAQALLFGWNLKFTLAWIASGLTFDITHMISNFCFGLMVLPLSKLLIKLHKASRIPV